jgi:hypothetical protein
MGVIRCDTVAGRVVAVIGGLVCLYWWQCYRQLQQ